MSGLVRRTEDAYLGLDDPSEEEWRAWHAAMLEERARSLAEAGISGDYDDPATDWSDTSFRQLFVFMYDASFYDRARGRYRTRELLAEARCAFGRVDSVLLWHAYPRLGFDERGQFDFYQDMPGGLAGLRADVCDVLHAEGVRVLVDYNPWAEGTYAELAAIVAALDADGVMLDTMTDAPDELARAIAARRAGVVLAPERRPADAELARHRQSWAQWYDLGDGSAPSILRHKWLVPRHMQHAIRRWDRSRRADVAASFFQGSGMLLWDAVFGAWNPYSSEDRRLLAETGAALDACGEVLARGLWTPLVPTGVRGLDQNRFELGGRAVLTLRSRADHPLSFTVPEGLGERAAALWGPRGAVRPGDRVEVPAGGVQAIVFDDPAATEAARARLAEAGDRAAAPRPGHDGREPPRIVAVPAALTRSAPAARSGAAFVEVPGGSFTLRIRHARRECGCYPEGVSGDATWGWYFEDPLEHAIDAVVAPFSLRASAVTNAEYLAFVRASGYRPRDPERFLAHLRAPGGELPAALDEALGALPVTFVSLDDARAFAAHHGERLPTEAEWQWAAEGAGRGRRYPWGDDERPALGALRAAGDPEGASPEGFFGMSGNAWELTESERSDGHTRFVMLRGGVFLPPSPSEWVIPRGPRPNDFHAKYILLADGLDRSATVSFRTAR